MRSRLLAVATLIALALAIAIGAGTARSAAPALAVAAVSASAFTASVTVDVDRASQIVAAFGTGTEPVIWSNAATASAPGRVTLSLTPLEPATAYRVVVTATAGGEPATAEASFRTGPMPTVAKGRVTPLGLKVNTRLLFPRMVFRQCPSAFPASIAAGVNVFMGTACGPPRQSMAALAGRALLLPEVTSRPDGPAVIGWHQLDEADILVNRADELPLVTPSSQTGRTTFLTLSNHVWSGAAQLPGAAALYPGLIARAEFIGVDLYPLQSFCRKDLLGAVYGVQRELVALAAGRPTFQWIEADPMGQCFGLDPSPAIVRAETWLAIAGGARGIGWFPENWKPSVRAEIAKLSTEIRSLAPALLSAEVPARVTTPSPVLAGARIRNGALYVIAVNPRFGRTSARITIPGLGNRTLRPLGEDRELRASADAFTDRFRGLQVRIYIAAPPPP